MKRIFILVLALAFLLTASACSSTDEKDKNLSSEQSSELIESENSELTDSVETSSNSVETSSKPTVTSKETTTTTTTSKPKPETSSEKVSTSSKNVYVETKPLIPYSSEPNTDTYRFTYAAEMCDDPELKAEIAQLNETFKDSGLKITLEGKGNKITFVYTFLTQMDAATIKGPLEEQLKAQKATFNSQVEILQAEVKNKMVLGIKYVNADGTVICETEFPQ